MGTLNEAAAAGNRPLDARAERRIQTLAQRFLTPAGVGITVAVAEGLTTSPVVFLRGEQDEAYGVAVTPSWQTGVWVTNKAPGGFTANFDNPAPSGGGTLDYVAFRA